MQCKITDAAALKLKEIMENEEDKQLKFRVFVGHAHGDHAHYGLGLDYQKDSDDLITTENGIDVLLQRGEKFLDGVEVDYDGGNDEWHIYNPQQGNHHHHG